MRRSPRLAAVFAFCILVAGVPANAQNPATTHKRQSPPTALDSAISELRYEDLAAGVKSLSPGPEQDYFVGILANREGHVQESIRHLQAALPTIRANPARAAVALHTLADDYIKSYRYREAVAAYQELIEKFSRELGTTELQGLKDDYGVAKLLKDAPPQSISFQGPVQFKTHHSPLGTIDADLTVNGVTGSWILDTGANYSVVSTSFAQRLGLRLSQEEARTQGISGAENRLRVAILPELRIGGAAVHNVVLLVLEDSSLNVMAGKDKRYQISAIVGYPVFQALERVTFSSSDEMSAGAAAEDASAGARLFMEDLTPMIECRHDGHNIVFSLDTGATSSMFSVRYYKEFEATFRSLKRKPFGIAGAGGVKMVDAYFLPHVLLTVGNKDATLDRVPVVPVVARTWMDKAYGNLGRDLMAPFSSFTLDFVNMRFALGERLPAAKAAARP